MSDNFQANPGSGGTTFASDDVSGFHYPRVKISIGTDGAAQDSWTPTKLISAATTNATSVKGSAGTLGAIVVTNINAAVRYLKLYDKASAPMVGTDVPKWTIAIPGNAAGAGAVIPLPVNGLAFTLGIAFAVTTGVLDSDTGAVAANEIIVNLGYA